MHIGAFAFTANPFATPEWMLAFGRGVEERGFHSLWVPEHVVLFDQYESKYPYAGDGRLPAPSEAGPIDPFAVLSFLAAATRTIRLGTGICLVPQRNPVYTAKEVAAVDWLSNGRFDFGVGVGWLAEEFQALGVPFERRGDRCRSYLEVMRRCWCDAVSQYEDEFYSLLPCRMFPKPIQQPHPPIYFGGESTAALKRVADVGQGWFGFDVDPDAARTHLQTLDRLLTARGRSRRDVQISVSPYMRPIDLDVVKRYRDAGVDQVIAMVFGPDRDSLLKAMDQIANTIVEPARRL
jgi:probable F420-dependent oxidoreductase